MSGNSGEEDTFPSGNLEDSESPRKRMRLDNSGRRGWSLMDRRTDQEVLQEMGVSLLEPDDNDALFDTSATLPQSKPSLKRKYNQENRNPNVNLANSPKSKSPRSPLKVCSPSPGPSRVKSPRSNEKSKPLPPPDHQALETTFLTEYLIDEETPLGQMTHMGYPTHVAHSTTSSGGTSCYASVPQDEAPCSGAPGVSGEVCGAGDGGGSDAFGVLSDEMLLSVFRWLHKRTLAHCMLVCKRWHRVACDETLWQRLDLGNRSIARGALGRVLARKPSVLRLANAEIGSWVPVPPCGGGVPSRVQYLDLSSAHCSPETLHQLLAACPLLAKLSLEGVPCPTHVQETIGKCSRLETLNLSMAQGITSDGLKAILEGCPGLQSLNVSWCRLSEASLQVLVSTLPAKLSRLNLAGARRADDDMVVALVSRCPRLQELDLSDCGRLTPRAAAALRPLARLHHLALSRCYLLPPHAFTKLSCLPSLQYLEVWGMLPASALGALRAALPAVQINQFMFSAIARPTVGARRTSIWGLRTRD